MSKERFVLLKAKLENNFSNNDFLVADKSGNIFNLKQLDIDRNENLILIAGIIIKEMNGSY